MINRGPVWTSVYHNKCRQQQFSLWRVHLLFPFNKFPASSNFLSVSVVEFYFLNGRQNPVNGKLMNSNAVRKREKKAKFVRLLSSFTIFISTQITFFSFFFFWNNNRVICRKIYFFITPLLRHLSHLFGQWNMLTVFHCTTVQKYGRRAEQQKAAPTKRILLLLLLFFPFFKQQIS